MSILSVITLASGLAFTPAHAASPSGNTHYQQARQTLDRMTTNAQVELRDRAVSRALGEGLVAFNDDFARRMAAHAREQVASNRGATAEQAHAIN
ncbi:MAG TPA: hypothetical protein VKA04_09605 [Pseudodesulfovibrio sp.]|nr:hypothetical protein [Pseudodesulfovibrio sp.]